MDTPLEGLTTMDTPLEGLTTMDTPLEGLTIMDTPLESWTIMDVWSCNIVHGKLGLHTHAQATVDAHMHTAACTCVLCVHASIHIDQCYCMTEVTRAEECTQDMFIVGAGCT